MSLLEHADWTEAISGGSRHAAHARGGKLCQNPDYAGNWRNPRWSRRRTDELAQRLLEDTPPDHVNPILARRDAHDRGPA